MSEGIPAGLQAAIDRLRVQLDGYAEALKGLRRRCEGDRAAEALYSDLQLRHCSALAELNQMKAMMAAARMTGQVPQIEPRQMSDQEAARMEESLHRAGDHSLDPDAEMAGAES